MNVAKFLYWLGVVVIIVGVLGSGYTFLHAFGDKVIGYTAGSFAVSIITPLWQGGLLIGIAEIIEKLHSKSN